jgi:tRNA uridine 5-carbamoylmethylation protein Kti12
MIILVAGYPKSGKSEVAKILSESFGEKSHWYRIENMVPENMSNIPSDVRSEIYMAAWDEIMDRFKSNIMLNNYDTIILDLCNPINYANENCLTIAKSKGQKIVSIFCNRPLAACIECADGDIEESAFTKYTDKFKKSLPKLNKLSERFIKINNVDDLSTLHDKVKKVRTKLCLNTSTEEIMT